MDGHATEGEPPEGATDGSAQFGVAFKRVHRSAPSPPLPGGRICLWGFAVPLGLCSLIAWRTFRAARGGSESVLRDARRSESLLFIHVFIGVGRAGYGSLGVTRAGPCHGPLARFRVPGFDKSPVGTGMSGAWRAVFCEEVRGGGGLSTTATKRGARPGSRAKKMGATHCRRQQPRATARPTHRVPASSPRRHGPHTCAPLSPNRNQASAGGEASR